jgi:hypothetical protein
MSFCKKVEFFESDDLYALQQHINDFTKDKFIADIKFQSSGGCYHTVMVIYVDET